MELCTDGHRYWEAKLAPGHMPSEAKIENFIRTKYESKRWVMDGPMPDPSTLEVEGDDDVVSPDSGLLGFAHYADHASL